MSLADAVSQRNVAHSALLALEHVEAALMPSGAHSRLFVAITACEAAMSYHAFPTPSGRNRLRLRLEDLQRVESNACDLGQLDSDSIIGHGLSLAIFVTQTALAGCSYNPDHALAEARLIVRLAERAA